MNAVPNDFEVVDLEIMSRPSSEGISHVLCLNELSSASSYLEQHEPPLSRARLLVVFPNPLGPMARNVTIVLVSSTFSGSAFNQNAKILILHGETKEQMIVCFSNQMKELFGGNVDLRVINK